MGISDNYVIGTGIVLPQSAYRYANSCFGLDVDNDDDSNRLDEISEHILLPSNTGPVFVVAEVMSMTSAPNVVEELNREETAEYNMGETDFALLTRLPKQVILNSLPHEFRDSQLWTLLESDDAEAGVWAFRYFS